MEPQAIVILDFGSQYTQLIARRIREQNVFSVVLPCTAPISEIESYSPAGIILSGGPCSVFEDDAPPADERVLQLGLPVLGICYALQLHPEVHHTKMGTELLRNFVFDICQLQPNWTAQQFIAETIASVKQTVGAGRAICALSGGVDSAVAAVLVHRALGERLTCI